MFKKNLDKLEFYKILEDINKFSCTIFGRNLVVNLLPSNNATIVSDSLLETNLALKLLSKKGEPSFGEISDIEVFVKLLESNNYLTAKAILEIGKILRSSKLLHNYFYSDSSFELDEYINLKNTFDLLYSNENLEHTIFSSIIDENTIADDASKALSSLRRNRKNLEQGIRNKLSTFVHSSSYSKYLMDSIITIRNDRYVIPVKEEYKDKISGSILDISASGSTLFIEPSSIFELNNKINNIKAEESIEIEKILKNLSISLFQITDKLKNTTSAIGHIDFIFAKAKYSKKMNAICPKINTNKYINLLGARHPLIDPNEVVPIDISIGENYTSLLITGPNTGGKTATLKTVGLLTIMACSGINIPAKENSSIYVFDNIFADIGDEQSIQQSLSTFSSHITNIIEIINTATSESLILLDELGSGTDPLQGSSLAISILEYFHNMNTLTICTTHYPELKNYALVTQGFENASSDFDVQKMQPTYKLLIGVPGKSNAFAISKNLGIPAEILDRASSFLKEDDISIENLIKEIYDDKLEIEIEKDKIQKNSNQIELLRKSLERDNSKLNAEANSIVSNAKIKAREILLDAKDEATTIIKELNATNISLPTANKLRNKLNNSINSVSNISSISDSNDKLEVISPDSIYIGQTVILKKLNQLGTIISLPNKSKEVEIQIGSMNTKVKISELLLDKNLNIKNKQQEKHIDTSKVVFHNTLKAKEQSTELNIIGLNIDEALPIVDKFLDDCYIASIKTIRIVHGKGSGKLRNAVQSFLKKHPHVENYRSGLYGEGEMGVTVVNLK